jgi:hypothetical protein
LPVFAPYRGQFRPPLEVVAAVITYGIYEDHQIVYYGTDIYSLYDAMFTDRDGMAVLDIPLHLRSKETNPEKKLILSRQFSRILLTFDFDPQSTHFAPVKILAMTEYFTDAADMGMLYLNYPMVEAFYHIKNIPDMGYNNCRASLSELKRKNETYKDRVNKESCISDRKRLFDNRIACNTIIRQNLNKAWFITCDNPRDGTPLPSQTAIVQKQLELLEKDDCICVLCTCCLYIVDYNPELIQE